MSSTIPGRARQIRVVGVPQRPGRPPQAPTRPPRVRRVRLGSDRGVPADVAEIPAARPVPEEPVAEPAASTLPDPTAMCCTVVRAAVEVLHGDRPAAQLARWLTPLLLDQLTERARLLREAAPSAAAARTTRPVQVRRIRLERRGETAEATVIVEDQGRCRAAAVRLEAHRGQWRLSVLELG
ncbi:TonB family protein [Xylanimonas cellulosilytica DSM 15894]|uniref:TonB family protein n=1 Tax=Xylanimonas cellulosilytica (strain DSM 15894 / JCM 12276 / CECT 5975 / KCTC 9989 / LMG 20990 / NBRC 107835 / XIL07) TaxID=446471 RepID=D1BWH4_XYLCX|nr:Rv3235 family protein [Xylanimonas cellulosilytica]ACZ31519.1 TonB family protein [Xylanimonas cellulosilytica DSM 15894]